MRIAISSIEVSERQRSELGDLGPLAASIAQHGLINPIVVEQVNDPGEPDRWRLIAGERRLRAHQALGLLEIEATPRFDCSQAQLQVLELEENIKRKDLTWQEEALAIRKYHELRLASDPTTTQADTARELSIDPAAVSRSLLVGEALALGTHPAILQADGTRAAVNIIYRNLDRAMSSALEFDLGLDEAGPAPDVAPAEVGTFPLPAKISAPAETGPSSSLPAPPPPPPPSPFQVLSTNFITWAESYSGPPFNFLHVDFPYGLNMGANPLQGTGADRARYDDSEDVYWALCDALFSRFSRRLIAESAHIMFWFSPKFMLETIDAITQSLGEAGFEGVVDPFPLIWHKSDGRGLLPDPQRGPRRVYETALHIAVGDRKIVQPVANAISLPTEKSSALHLSEKPEPVLAHFFRLYVDEHSRVLDPTCGAGSALAVARRAGAASVLGIELDPEAAQLASTRLAGAI